MKNSVCLSVRGTDGHNFGVGDVAIVMFRSDCPNNCSFMYNPYVVRKIQHNFGIGDPDALIVENLKYINVVNSLFRLGEQKDTSPYSLWRSIHPSLIEAMGIDLKKHGVNANLGREPYKSTKFAVGDIVRLKGITHPNGLNDNSWKDNLFVIKAIDFPYAVVTFAKPDYFNKGNLFVNMNCYHFEKVVKENNTERKITMNLDLNLQNVLARLFGVDTAQVKGVKFADKVSVTVDVDKVTTSDGQPAVGVKSIKVDFGY